MTFPIKTPGVIKKFSNSVKYQKSSTVKNNWNWVLFGETHRSWGVSDFKHKAYGQKAPSDVTWLLSAGVDAAATPLLQFRIILKVVFILRYLEDIHAFISTAKVTVSSLFRLQQQLFSAVIVTANLFCIVLLTLILNSWYCQCFQQHFEFGDTTMEDCQPTHINLSHFFSLSSRGLELPEQWLSNYIMATCGFLHMLILVGGFIFLLSPKPKIQEQKCKQCINQCLSANSLVACVVNSCKKKRKKKELDTRCKGGVYSIQWE